MNQSCAGWLRAPLSIVTLLLCLLLACERPPVVQLELRGVPQSATRVEVWTWINRSAAASALSYPIDAPRDVQRLGLRLSAMERGELELGLGAFDQGGCLLALGEGRGVVQGVDVIVRATLEAVPPGTCGAARPLVSSATPGATRTLAQEPLVLRGLGFSPGMRVRIGEVEAPLSKVLSPTTLAGALPALPGRVGALAVTVHDAAGAPLVSVRTPLKVTLSELYFESVIFPPDNVMPLVDGYGWLSAIPRPDGRSDLLQLNWHYQPSKPVGERQPPALLLRSVGRDRLDFTMHPFPHSSGIPLYGTAVDLNGDGRRDEVLISACASVAGYSCDSAGATSYVTAFRISGINIDQLGVPLTLPSRRIKGNSPTVKHGHLRPAGADGREAVVLTWQVVGADNSELPRAFEYRLNAQGQLEEAALPAEGFRPPFALAALGPGLPPAAVTGCYDCGGFSLLSGLTKPILFEIPTNPSFRNPQDVLLVDVDGDARLDLLAPLLAGGLGAWRNVTAPDVPGELRLELGQILPCGTKTTSIAAADLDGDGRAEVLCGEIMVRSGAPAGLQNGLEIYTFLPNRGAAGAPGRFQSVPLAIPVATLGPGGPTSIATGDFDGDGRVDVAAIAPLVNNGLLFLWNRSE